MYLPTVFAERDVDRLLALIDAHPLATMVASTAGGPVIEHVPVLVDRREGTLAALRLHVARRNALASLADGTKVVAVIQGPDGYVSPRWYEEPLRQVPTWNYAVVHAHGTLRRLSTVELEGLLEDMAARFEPTREGWRPAALAPGLREEMLAEIAGLRIDLERMEGKLKVSQNRSPADRARVRAALEARGRDADLELAALMGSPSPERLF